MSFAEVNAVLAAKLLDRYAREWIVLAGLPPERLSEVADTVEVVVAPDWNAPADSGLQVLRLRSWYTGSTYWLYDWDGSAGEAEAWIDSVADLQAGNVSLDREYGPTPWDDPSGFTPAEGRPVDSELRGIIENDDPGEEPNGIRLEQTFPVEPTPEVVAEVVDRLQQSSDVPPEVASQALARAAGGSPHQFFEWLASSLTQPDAIEPIGCDCGAALLDPSQWHGRATVRCGACGARWGVDSPTVAGGASGRSTFRDLDHICDRAPAQQADVM